MALAVVAAVLASAPAESATAGSPTTFALALQEPQSAPPQQPQTPSTQPQNPSRDLDVDINVNRSAPSGAAWYRSPVWIAIGALAFIVLLVVIMVAARGSGNTVIRE
jgi:hypothetical protein